MNKIRQWAHTHVESLLGNDSEIRNYTTAAGGHEVAWLVEAVCYKPEGRGFDSR
jgi:hypothetical protein